MASEALYAPTEYFRPFPAPESVFATDVERHAEFLFPLASVSLSVLNARWRGDVHFVIPIETHDGFVGQYTKQYHSYLCRKNWIGFKLNRNNRYTLGTDFRYFVTAGGPRKDVKLSKAAIDQLKTSCVSARESFEKRRQHFNENNALHYRYARRRAGRYSDKAREPLVYDLGGIPGWGNWSELELFPVATHQFVNADGDEETNCLPLAEDGSEFVFVGWLPAYVYVEDCGCNLYLFYNRRNRLALTTFDWS